MIVKTDCGTDGSFCSTNHHHHHKQPHHGELGVQAEGDEHGEEEEGPDGRQRHLGHCTRVGDEGEARASLNK